MKELYQSLMAELSNGNHAAIVSTYGSDGIFKTLYSESSPSDWEQLISLLSDPSVRQDGPVFYLENESGLTVVEKYLPVQRMIIFGGGHIALALTSIAKMLGFHIIVYDDRPAFANGDRFPEANQVICDDFSRAFEHISIGENDYVIILTRGHKHDTECIEGVLNGQAPAYTGMIGSRRRVAIVRQQLKEQGYDEALIDRVHSPIGLKIGAVTPAEISISILAEVIQVKRQENGSGKNGGEYSSDLEIAEWLAKHGDEADALITILQTSGSVPRETGAKMAINYEGKTVNTIGGGCAESDVIHRARTIIRNGGYEIVTVDMTDTAEEDGMVCGGQMQVLIESRKSISAIA